MDDLTSGVDPDELMDLDEAECSDLEEDDEDVIEDTLPSPLQLPSSGPASTATSAASSPPTNDDIPPVFNFTGKPLNIKRGRGRPRREGGKPAPKRQNSGIRKRWKPQSYLRGMAKRYKTYERGDYEFASVTPSPGDESSMYDPETGALMLNDRERPLPPFEELPYAPEQWSGKVCAFCNLGERSQLGQGEMLRLICSEGFTPQRIVSDMRETQMIEQAPGREVGDKSPRGPVTCRRQKSYNKCRHPSMTSEYIDELTIIGYTEDPDVTTIFEQSGHFYVHRSCSLWSNGVRRAENTALINVDQAVLLSASKKCSHCNHYGASVTCKEDGCTKIYHFPCATASGAFQELSTLLVFCTSHLFQVSLLCEGSVCYRCKMLGDISNLVYCSVCGEHYHGSCVGLAQLPGVRAGWQCDKCKVCQVCRMVGDETKLMTCDTCHKVYHGMCQRPIVTSIPKYGWKCRCCRVCSDCGSRTPGAGLSSRWHAHYTVCDSCYQQRNKGCSCPICGRAYRAHAHREMVQCALCRKFVHGTCDAEADLTTYHQRKEIHPEYDYICPVCKNVTQQGRPILTKRNSVEDGGDSLSASQESLIDDIYEYDPEKCGSDEIRAIGLGRGKPYSASKIAKKRLGLSTGMAGRPKGIGKAIPGKVGFMKRQKISDFGRKRGPKSKMRGVFGVPGVGLQRPVSDGKNDDESGVENKLILCSAKDRFVLTQDICVMCGAVGTDQEGCLIACVQCGQCYHPYCVNVKVTKVILQKGWHCLDCIVCQGCGQRNDEGRLLLCDDCDISFHIYCMDPPLNFVPQGTWKCKWCAICQTCGTTDPGFNCNWMNSYTECGPCASFVCCPSCSESYNDGDLIIQCVQCSRWLHGACDSIKTEQEAEKCSEDGYNCILCRPRDVAPPHLLPLPMPKPPTPTKSPEGKANNQYLVDGVCLSEIGHVMIKSLSLEMQITRKKRKKIPTVQDKEAGIMATIESVIASSSISDVVDIKDEPLDLYKEGMIWGKEDGPPPEGFTLFTMENGITVLRRKRQRNLQKLGIGGFLVRARGLRNGQDNDDIDILPGQSTSDPFAPPPTEGDKPRRKPVRRKVKSKLAETFPPYLQDAFFGRDLLDTCKEVDSSSGSEEDPPNRQLVSLRLSQDEIKAVAAVSAKPDKVPLQEIRTSSLVMNKSSIKNVIIPKEEEESDTEDLNLAIPGELLDTDLVNTIMNEDDDELTKTTDTLENLADASLAEDLADSLTGGSSSKDAKDEFSDILGPHFNFIPNINSKDVEDIFKGVLTDESQESQESSVFSTNSTSVFNSAIPAPQKSIITHPTVPQSVRPSTLPNVNQNSLNSLMSFPPQSPYHSEYSNSPQFSPAFSEPPSPWVTVNDSGDMDGTLVPSNNQRSSEKMKADEGLAHGATISAVLYANTNHPEWKTEYPAWSDRYKQIIKKWRTLSNEQKAPFLQQAKDNRSALRMKKQQQDPDKLALHQKSSREAEQEKQWKQLQALRQQHQQQQQQIIQEQRVQATARVHRQLSDPTPPFMSPEQQNPLQQTAHQEVIAPLPSNQRAFNPIGIKSPPFTHPGAVGPRTPLPSPSVQPQTPASPFEFMANTSSGTPDPFTSASVVTTPKPTLTPQPRVPLPLSDPYAHQPATPRPQAQFAAPRPALQSVVRPDGAGIEVNRQLRDLLQRQQFKKLDEQLLPGKGPQRVWSSMESAEAEQVIVSSASGDSTFRHPLPPGMRPRMLLPTARQPGNIVGIRMQQPDSRMQGLDARARLLLQHHQQQRALATVSQPMQTQFQQSNPRFPVNIARPAGVEQYEQIQRQVFQPRSSTDINTSRLPNLSQVLPKMPPQNSSSLPTNTTATDAMDQEIPDNVTAELEKLEQDGTMAELQVGDILSGLPDDDDELLAEMGNDFNILEYADPELDALTAGEKTNILDSLELEEPPQPAKDDKKTKAGNKLQSPQPPATTLMKSEPKMQMTSPVSNMQQQPTVLPIQQIQVQHQPTPTLPQQLTHQQQLHQQMLLQVQQAAAGGRPMAPGTRLVSPDGIYGTVTPNNNVTLSFPAGYQQRFMTVQLQQQLNMAKLRQNLAQNPRLGGPITHGGAVGMGPAPRMNIGNPPPPPPPYPGPPPPYPGSATPQEQPLLLEELLEQEKREQEKQMQPQVPQSPAPEVSSTTPSTALLSDHDFEKLKADVFNSGPITFGPSSSSNSPVTKAVLTNQTKLTYQKQLSSAVAGGLPSGNQWQQPPPAPTTPTPRVPIFNANLQPAPPLPPEHIVTEQDKQTQMAYEEWLNYQNNALTQQLRFYENEVQKLRKLRKSLNSKQRQLKKSGNQLAENDAIELERISQEQAILQKHLESTRKQVRQHGMLIQEYRNKQQSKQRPGPGQSPLMSPLGPPGASPIHTVNTPQSPLMSPSASPMTQHSSPMHSPAPLVSHSPGPGSVSNVLQSPNHPASSSMSPMQPSPRIGTPHSQSEGSPGPVQSPSQICLPPPVPRMTSPQQRRVVTSPIGYTGDIRPGTPQGQLRFVRQPLDANALQQRTRLQSPSPNFQQKPGTPSPLNSPPVQQMQINHQLLQRQQVLLQHQVLLQQQQQQQGDNNEGALMASQRTLLLIQQRNLAMRQQQLAQQASNQPQPLTPQQHQLMVQQQQQLAKQQQQQIALQQAQARVAQPPNSPMPHSPLVSQPQIMSPHSMHSQPASPMPPRSPIVSGSPISRSPALHQGQNQPPSSPMMHSHQPPSPMPRSPMINQIQSPMGVRRPPSSGSSPMPDRPTSVENPGTPRTPYNPHQAMDHDHGGGNPHNPANPIPFPPGYGRFGYFRLGLRGGSPMWGYGRGAKRVPNGEGKEEKATPGEISAPPPKFKKESHADRVSILRKKSPVKSNLQTLTLNHRISLVSSDYSEFDDSSSTPPVTPPPSSSTNRSVPRSVGKKISDPQNDQAMQAVDGSPEQMSIIDYDDDNVVSAEVSLSAAAHQPDSDDITVIESFSQSELPETFSSPLESDQITDEYLLFDMPGGVQYSEKEDEEDDDYQLNDKSMQIVIQSPTTSDEELILQGKTKEADGLTLNLMEGLTADQLLVTESPTDLEEHVEGDTPLDGSEIIFIESTPKTPEEISTKEDFEELIDEGSRKEKIIKADGINPKHINEFHKYAANIYTYPQKVTTVTTSATVKTNTISIVRPATPGQKISLLAPVLNANIMTSKVNISKKDGVLQQQKAQTSLANIILQSTSNARSSIITVPKTQFVNIVPTHFSVPVISASAVSKLPNVKVIEKPSTSMSLSTSHEVPKKIFEDDSKSPDCDEERIKLDQQFDKIKEAIEESNKKKDEVKEEALERKDESIPKPPTTKLKEDVMIVSEKLQVQPSTMKNMIESKNSMCKPLIMHNPPELKMTAQVIQEGIIRSGTVERMPFITQTIEEVDGNSNDLDNKSVVISIPSPTPSQEQILDHIALQALETRRQDGWIDVLEMFEDNLIDDKYKIEDTKIEHPAPIVATKQPEAKVTVAKLPEIKENPALVTVVSNAIATTMPQLSPLSQPAELTNNVANVSQQLRTLLSSLNTTTVTMSSNVGTVAKNVYKEKLNVTAIPTSVTTPRVVQQNDISSAVTTSSVIVASVIKPKVATPKSSPTVVSVTGQVQTTCNVVTSTTLNILTSRSNELQFLSEHPKLVPITTSSKTIVTIASENKKIPSPTTFANAAPKKASLSLNEMLQSHPAATTPQSSPGTITAASILGSAIPLSRNSFTSALVKAQPHVISPMTPTSVTPSSNNTQFKPSISTSNFLHSQLTKAPVQRTKSLDEMYLDKRKDDVITTSAIITTSSLLKQEIATSKFSSIQTNANRTEDSQNVLLKQLLQNTGCATVTTTPAVTTTSSTVTAPSLPIVPNLEAQLARPVPPTPSSLIPPILQNDSTHPHQQQPQPTPHMQQQQQKFQQRQPLMTRETSFVSKPVAPLPPVSTPVTTQQQLHIDIKKALPPCRTPSRDDLLSPQTPRSTCSQDSNITTPPLVVKREPMIPTTIQSPLLTPQEVKKEFVDESSQHSEVSDHSRGEVQMKEELMEVDEKMDKEEMKKMKRRMYQQKRRMNQILNKEQAGQPKKRPRKSSKVDEDYDSFIEGLLANLRTLPPMTVSEAPLNKNFGVVPAFGSGDLSKLGSKEYDSRVGDLNGTYGNAIVPGSSDYYNSKPYGDDQPLPETPSTTTQRGFYDQEFSLIKFDIEDDRRFDLFCREDTPDSVVSLSPECMLIEPIAKVPGLKLIEEEDEDVEMRPARTLSPRVPIVTPVPIRLKPAGPYLKDYGDVDKENIGKDKDFLNLKSKFGPTPTTPLKDSGNVTVTLTLTSSAAEDIMGVLRDLANILHIPAPTSYQIVERTTSPPSQKLGLYRTKGKDGKEGAPIDIQSILNGAAKFCKHCDVVILNNMIRKKVSEIPFLNKDLLKDADILGDGDELYFCSLACYMQFALMNRSPALSENNAAAIVDHLCQKDKADILRKKQILERQASQLYHFESKRQSNFVERMNVDLDIRRGHFMHEMHVDNSYSLVNRCEEGTQTKTDECKFKNIKYKKYVPGCLQPINKYKKASDKETMELLYKLGVTVVASKNFEDSRKCMFCHNIGDGVADGPARLLNFDVDKWVHLNCALWSDGVYETVNGALMHLENALQQSLVSTCIHCNQLGATIRCFKTRCSNIYHLPCAIKDSCVFYKNKTVFCTVHVQKLEKDSELTTLSVSRRVYVNRDENRQVAAVMHHSDQNNLLRVGSLIFLSVGQLLPHQLQNFHSANYIYPIGYKIVRFYWSMRHLNKRCRYVCSIHEQSGKPQFRILVQELNEEDLEFRDITAKGVWNKVIEPVAVLRKENYCVQIFSKYITGEDLFGLTEPAVVRVLESLPGIETLTDYKFKYGRNPLLELPLAINPSGAARTEPRLRNQLHWKRAHTQRTGSSARPVFAPTTPGTGEVTCPYSKQFVHSKSSQYKKMKQEWRNNVYLARSKIQGLGLYAARDLEKHTMVIEYIGEIIRTELAETREKKYEAKNRGIYMFRLDEERVVDATLSGGLARYINHSCNPNCVAEIVEVDRDLRIIIFAKRRIQRGEELSYDYKFDIEDDQHKISCMCGAPNCRKWMN